ncbi:tail fiber domain-containing protein [Cupriavidus plantarum]|uniref:tail fiber domain-containing protein n=1 Tax=Cupriavidus plantarum TaxID=942865 RepID=UPI000EB23431|nr:tail fiber domain-containing protein [Cupriavidus plantarum]RLK45943.1 endosialidase-like protein [Cupriavidus plantarum]
MAKQLINLGSEPEGQNGDTSRVAFLKAMANFDELYARTTGRLQQDIAGAAGLVSLSDAQAQYGVIELSGAITGARDVTVPATERTWLVWNVTTGSDVPVKFRTEGGAGVVVARGTAAFLYSNGVDVVDANAVLRALIAAKADTAYVDAGLLPKADKTYVDTALAGKISTNPGKGGGFFFRGDGAWSTTLGNVFQSQGSTQPGYEFHIPGVSAAMIFLQQDASMVFANSNGSSAWTGTRAVLTSGGSLALAGTLSQGSDMRIKANVRTIENALSKVRALRGVTFQRMLPSTAPYAFPDGEAEGGEPSQSVGPELPPKLGEVEIGVIAQEVMEVCPELVSVPDASDGTLSVMYANMAGLLLQAIRELADAHDALAQRVVELETR